MKRRMEYLVRKRDGRSQWLRSAKLARSIAAALEAVEGPEVACQAIELASLVLVAVRRRRDLRPALEAVGGGSCLCTTDQLSALVERALFVSGHPQAAVRYTELRVERARRGAWLAGGRRRRVGRVTVPGVRTRVTFDHN